jgi:hypothetical protein
VLFALNATELSASGHTSGVISNASASTVAAFVGGLSYLNVHTAAFPAGEIRGQEMGLTQPPVVDFGYATLGPQAGAPAGASGTAFVAINENTGTLTFSVTATGLSAGGVTAAHFHGPAVVGADAGVLFTIVGFPAGVTSGSTSGVLTGLTALQIGYFQTGQVYVNVHTALVPSGEVRGQVVVGNVGGGALTGAASVPPQAVVSNASGTVATKFIDGGGALGPTLWYQITVAGLSGAVTAAHLHAGAATVAGGVLYTVAGLAGAVTVTGTWSGLSPAQVLLLVTNGVYLNVHTAANPSGEIRAQIVGLVTPPAPVGMGGTADLLAQSGSKAGAAGTVALLFVPGSGQLQLSVTVSSLSGAVTGAHIHGPAAPGVDGGVLVPVPGLVGQTSWQGMLSIASLTQAQITALVTGNVYFNVHTTQVLLWFAGVYGHLAFCCSFLITPPPPLFFLSFLFTLSFSTHLALLSTSTPYTPMISLLWFGRLGARGRGAGPDCVFGQPGRVCFVWRKQCACYQQH